MPALVMSPGPEIFTVTVFKIMARIKKDCFHQKENDLFFNFHGQQRINNKKSLGSFS
jgi:hypothetical protein